MVGLAGCCEPGVVDDGEESYGFTLDDRLPGSASRTPSPAICTLQRGPGTSLACEVSADARNGGGPERATL